MDGCSVKVDVFCEEAGIYKCSYTPTGICKHTITVSWGGVSVPGSPFIVSIILIYVPVIIMLQCDNICLPFKKR